MAILVIVSMFSLSWETTGYTRVDSRTPQQKDTLRYFFAILGFDSRNSSSNASYADFNEVYNKLHPGLELSLTTCYVFITLEIILRMISCPNFLRYLKSPIHICEILGTFSFWLNFFVDLYLEHFKSIAGFIFFIFVKYLVILQMSRIVRIAKHSTAFNIMSLSVKSSLPEIGVLFALLVLLVTMFGWLMLAVEYSNDKFDSCFTGMYWALITLTTVGYGDYYPETIIGHVLAGACAVCGVVTLAMPISLPQVSIVTILITRMFHIILRNINHKWLGSNSTFFSGHRFSDLMWR